MKKILFIALICSLISTFTFAQSKDQPKINEKTGFPEITDKPFIIINEGLSTALVTRIQLQENRNNFVYENIMIGAFVSAQTVNMKPINSLVQLTVYYPLENRFNGMSQSAKQVILYAGDLFAGPIFESNFWEYVKLNFSVGLHYMYQLTDEYHLNYLGAGAKVCVELPVAKTWTIITNGMMTIDYPNFGSNKKVQPFDYSWQYHLDIGVRYSIKAQNVYSYIK